MATDREWIARTCGCAQVSVIARITCSLMRTRAGSAPLHSEWLNHFDARDGNKSGFEMVFQFAAAQFALPIDLASEVPPVTLF
ncbi:hypothetical protein [Paraburkholderia aspalathi]|uniref:hypothetical protein n=1 Tax=Paraburkholderia aspalathi TaxID=1324617 RepID=UPI0038BC4C74